MTRQSPLVIPQPCLPAATYAQWRPTPALRAETLSPHKTNPATPPNGLSDALTTAAQWPKPPAQWPPQHIAHTPIAPNAS